VATDNCPYAESYRSTPQANQREDSRQQRSGCGHYLGGRAREPLRFRLFAREMSLRHLQRRSPQKRIARREFTRVCVFSGAAHVQAQGAGTIGTGGRPIRDSNFVFRRPFDGNLFLRTFALDLPLRRVFGAAEIIATDTVAVPVTFEFIARTDLKSVACLLRRGLPRKPFLREAVTWP
jgi:hypothetical protein